MGIECWVETEGGKRKSVALNLDAGGSRMNLVIYSIGFFETVYKFLSKIYIIRY